MSPSDLNDLLAPYAGVLLTILLAFLAIRLLGDTVVEFAKFLIVEIRGAFAGKPLYALNFVIMLMLLLVLFALFVPNPLSEMAGLVHPERDPIEIMKLKIGAACFAFFLIVLAGIFSALICRRAP